MAKVQEGGGKKAAIKNEIYPILSVTHMEILQIIRNLILSNQISQYKLMFSCYYVVFHNRKVFI